MYVMLSTANNLKSYAITRTYQVSLIFYSQKSTLNLSRFFFQSNSPYIA